MTDLHGGHALIESVAALVLTAGGAAIVVWAWLGRGRSRPRGDGTTGSGGGIGSRGVIALVSGAAAAIHLAAGPEHVEALGDLGLGFYWAAVAQGAFALAWLASTRPAWLAVAGIGVNATVIAVWAWSRTVGIGLPGGPEAIGVADGISVVLEAGVIVVLGTSIGFLQSRLQAVTVRIPATSTAVTVVGVAFLASAIAIADLSDGHGHAHEHVAGSTTVDMAHAVTP